MIAVVLAGVASAADCAPLSEPALRSMVAEAKAAVDRDDLVDFAEARRNLFDDLPCLEGPLPADAWARFLLDEAVVAFALGEPWEDPLRTALSLDPDLPRGDLPQELRDQVATPSLAPMGAPLAPGAFLLDGRPLAAVPALSGLHVVQRVEDRVYTTRVLRDTPFPADWQAPVPVPDPVVPEARRRGSPPLIATGAALAVVGAGLGVGTWAARGSVEQAAAGDRLVAANVAGWSVSAAGVVLGGVGFAVGGRF